MTRNIIYISLYKKLVKLTANVIVEVDLELSNNSLKPKGSSEWLAENE